MAMNRHDKRPEPKASDEEKERAERDYNERLAVREESERLENYMLYKSHPAAAFVLDEILSVLRSAELEERLACVEHDRWSNWMKHQFTVSSEDQMARWKRLMLTPYEELDAPIKELDRIEARKSLQIVVETLLAMEIGDATI